jgi:hypothetical protein
MSRQFDDSGGPCILLCLLPFLALELTLLASAQPGTKDSRDRADESANKTDCELDMQRLLRPESHTSCVGRSTPQGLGSVREPAKGDAREERERTAQAD